VAAGQKREHDLVNDLPLADDDLAELGRDFLAAGDETLDGVTFGFVGGGTRTGGVRELMSLSGSSDRR